MSLRSPRLRRFQLDSFTAIGTLGVLAILALVGLPVVWVTGYAFSDDHGPSLASLWQVATDPTLIAPLGITLVISACVAVFSLIVAIPLAWLISRTDIPFSRTIRVVVLSTYVVPPFLGAVAWELLAAPNAGLINVLARELTDMPPFEYLVNIYSVPGLIFVDTCYTFAFAFTLVATALDRVPNELEEASAIFGASRLGTLRQITLPLVMPALLASMIVAFLHSMIEFGTPGVLALPAGFHTVTTRIWSLFQYPPQTHIAAAASMPLLVITVLLLLAQNRLTGRRQISLIGGKGQRVAKLSLGALRWPVLAGCLLVLAIPVFLPLWALIRVAFATGGDGVVDIGHWGWDNWRFVFGELSSTWPAFANTLKLGIVTATLGAALALVLAYVATRRSLPGSGLVGIIAMIPAAIPSIVLAVGMFVAYTRPPLLLYGTLGILLLAFITTQTPSAFQQIGSALRGLHPELEEAARIFGATRLRAIADVVIPLVRPSLIAAWCFMFVGAIRELSAAILLFTTDTETVPVLIYDLNEGGRLGPIAVLGLTLLMVTMLVVIVANLIGGRRPS